jgi:hypothetical protein
MMGASDSTLVPNGILMRFIEMNGSTLALVINEGELNAADLEAAGVTEETIVRVNQHGDIEIRRRDHWDVIGGLLGDYDERIRGITGLDWV